MADGLIVTGLSDAPNGSTAALYVSDHTGASLAVETGTVQSGEYALIIDTDITDTWAAEFVTVRTVVSSGGVSTTTFWRGADGTGDIEAIYKIIDLGGPFISSPVAGATLASVRPTFIFDNAGDDSIAMDLHISSTPFEDGVYRAGELYDSSSIGAVTSDVPTSDLPDDGRTLYVRLHYSRTGGDFGSNAEIMSEGRYFDITYTAFTASTEIPPLLQPGQYLAGSAENVRAFGGGTQLMDGLTNLRCGGAPNGLPAMRFRAEHGGRPLEIVPFWITSHVEDNNYSAGTGGTIEVHIFPIDANGHPDMSGSPIASGVHVPELIDGDEAYQNMTDAVALSGSTDLIKNQLYTVVFRNIDANPGANYLSVNMARYNFRTNDYAQPWKRWQDAAALWSNDLASYPSGADWSEFTEPGDGNTIQRVANFQVTTTEGTFGQFRTETGNLSSRRLTATSSVLARTMITPQVPRAVQGWAVNTAFVVGGSCVVELSTETGTIIDTHTITDATNVIIDPSDRALLKWYEWEWANGIHDMDVGEVFFVTYRPQGSAELAFPTQRDFRERPNVLYPAVPLDVTAQSNRDGGVWKNYHHASVTNTQALGTWRDVGLTTGQALGAGAGSGSTGSTVGLSSLSASEVTSSSFEVTAVLDTPAPLRVQYRVQGSSTWINRSPHETTSDYAEHNQTVPGTEGTSLSAGSVIQYRVQFGASLENTSSVQTVTLSAAAGAGGTWLGTSGMAALWNLPSSDVAIGSMSKSAYDSATGNTWSDIGDADYGIQTVESRKGLAVRMHPTPGNGNNGTDRLQSYRAITNTAYVRVRFLVYFPDGFDFGGPDRRTGKIGPGLFFGDDRSTGGALKNNAGSARPTYQHTGSGDEVRWTVYLYHQDQSGTYGDEEVLRDSGGNEIVVTRGEWHEYVLEGQAQSSASASDGVIRAYIDGVLGYEDTSFRWVSSGGVLSRELLWFMFMGGSNSSADPDRYVPDGDQTMYLADAHFTLTP